MTSSLVLSQVPGFDPLTVPVVGEEEPLRALQAHEYCAASILQKFQAAQPFSVQPHFVSNPQTAKREAAVLVGLVLRHEVTLLLTQRAAHLKTHSGQVAFPGGKVDPQDTSVEAAALREAHEEVGLEVHHVQVVGRLPVLETGTAFRITPVVALIDPLHEINFNANEVAHVFEVPMSFLMDPSNHRKHRLEHQGQTREWYSMPYKVDGQEHFIWGATASMIRNFYAFLSA
ncbi:MAG: CoA pyrophosphatase [Betaproteobacteria bacterium]|jgi:8-oxo-dGTP pyrophosphatase MutT (NUDIX family)